MSDTPRTDAIPLQCYIVNDPDPRQIPCIDVEHARGLERELAAQTAYAGALAAAATTFLTEYRREFYTDGREQWSDPMDTLDVAYHALKAAVNQMNTSPDQRGEMRDSSGQSTGISQGSRVEVPLTPATRTAADVARPTLYCICGYCGTRYEVKPSDSFSCPNCDCGRERLPARHLSPAEDRVMHEALRRSVKVIPHPDTERLDWMMATYGFTREAIDKVRAERPAVNSAPPCATCKGTGWITTSYPNGPEFECSCPEGCKPPVTGRSEETK